MRRVIMFIIMLILILSSFFLTAGETPDSIYQFKMKDIDGSAVSLEQFKGKTLLLVNVASKCGLTSQYKGLQELYRKFKVKGLVILGFPANNFGGQEPGTNKEIKLFCTENFGVKFPMFAKISVKGNDIHPLYKYLTDKSTNPKFPGDIRWNFDKFLIGPTGKILARFHPKSTPQSKEVLEAIKKTLK